MNKNQKKNSRNFSGVPRRLLDGSNRQISSIAASAVSAALASSTAAAAASSASANNNVHLASNSPYGTLCSIKSTHSSSSSSNGSQTSSSSSNNVITFQCASADTGDAVGLSGTGAVGLPSTSSSASLSQQQQQQQQQYQQSLVAPPAAGTGLGGVGSGFGYSTTVASTAGGNSGNSLPIFNNSNSGGNSPRLGDAALSSLAASPTDACSMRSNPSAASLLAAGEMGAATGISGVMGNSSATLSPLSSAGATAHLIRRPSITMCVNRSIIPNKNTLR